MQPARLKKRKSVTFSDNVVDGPCDGRELPSASEQISDDDGSTSNKKTDSPEKCLDNPPLFHVSFSNKSFPYDYQKFCFYMHSNIIPKMGVGVVVGVGVGGWAHGLIFIYSCSALLIPFDIDCLYGL